MLLITAVSRYLCLWQWFPTTDMLWFACVVISLCFKTLSNFEVNCPDKNGRCWCSTSVSISFNFHAVMQPPKGGWGIYISISSHCIIYISCLVLLPRHSAISVLSFYAFGLFAWSVYKLLNLFYLTVTLLCVALVFFFNFSGKEMSTSVAGMCSLRCCKYMALVFACSICIYNIFLVSDSFCPIFSIFLFSDSKPNVTVHGAGCLHRALRMWDMDTAGWRLKKDTGVRDQVPEENAPHLVQSQRAQD